MWPPEIGPPAKPDDPECSSVNADRQGQYDKKQASVGRNGNSETSPHVSGSDSHLHCQQD